MQAPRRSVLTGQPLDAPPPVPPPPPRRREVSPRGPLLLLALAVLLLAAAAGLVGVWHTAPGALPFVPRTATPLQPSPSPSPTPQPTATATIAPIPNPGGRDVTQELRQLEMLAGGFGWGLGPRSVWRTGDGGQTWFDVTPPLPDGAEIEQAFFITRLNAWFVLPRPGEPASLYTTADGGQTWEASPAPFESARVFFLGEWNGWALDASEQPPAVFHTPDGGREWRRLPAAGLPAALPAGAQLAFADLRRGWLALPGPRPALYASLDAGQTWTERRLPLPRGYDWAGQDSLSLPHFFDGDYAPGVLPVRVVEQGSGRELLLFFTSLDGGATWQAGRPLETAGAQPAVPYSAPAWGSLFVVDGQGVLQRSRDAGATWQAAGGLRDAYGSGLRLAPQGIDFTTPDLGWAWQVDGGRLLLFETGDGGGSWRRVEVRSPAAGADAPGGGGEVFGVLAGAESPPAAASDACRWQPADFKLPLLPITEDGPHQGWNLYLNPAHRFSFALPPGWSLTEISYACSGRPRDVHRLVLYAPGDAAALTLGFRLPGQAVPLREAAPTGLRVDGQAQFFWRQAARAVQDAAAPGAVSAVYYDHGREIEVGSAYVFTAALESSSPAGPLAPLDPAVIEQAEMVLASLEPLRASQRILSTMDVNVSTIESPGGDFTVEVLLARPLVSSPVGFHYQRVQVLNRATGRRWPLFETWVRAASATTSPTGLFWTPDGRYLYHYSHGVTGICRLFEHHNGLRRLDLASGQVQEIDLYPDSPIASFDISPDGRQVAFLPPDFLSDPRIVVRSLEPGGPAGDTVIPFAAPVVDHWGAGSIRWSPDGRRLVFALAGPYCAQQEEMRMVVLVDPVSGQARALTAGDRWLTINRWLPDGRLRLADRLNNLFTLDVDSGDLDAIPPDPPDRLAEAESHLRGFFMMLHNTWFDPGTYQWAAGHYGGSYDPLTALNPDVDPRDTARLFERACTQNGYYCLRVRRVTGRELAAQDGGSLLFRFTVEFSMADGSLFALNGRSEFPYTVAYQPNGQYLVMDLPPHGP